MAKKKGRDKEDFSTLSANELNVRLAESQEQQFRLKFSHANNPLKNPMQIRFKRREIAQLKTWLRRKEAKAQ
jgi:ribosomal protein L29